MQSQRFRSSTRPWNSSAMAKPQGRTAFQPRCCRTIRKLSSQICTTSSACAGEKVRYHRSCRTPTLSPCTRTRATRGTATATMSSRFSSSLASSSLELQCEFHANRSTIDMVFSLKQLQEKCRDQQQPLFIDLTEAFDLVSRDGSSRSSTGLDAHPDFSDMRGTMFFDGSTSEAFNIRSGVKQACVLEPTLFGIFFTVLLKYSLGNATEGIYLRTRLDEKLFNLF